jgi:SAM-dependent methyltransferase
MGLGQRRPPPVRPDLYDRTYFLNHCGGYDVYASSRGAQLDDRLSVILQMARVEPGMRVLDVGCGRGELVRHSAEVGALAWGMDFSWEALSISSATMGGAECDARARTGRTQASAGDIPFANRTFDRVFLSDILEHLVPPLLCQMIQEVHRVLLEDGWVVFHTFPNRWFYNVFYPIRRLLWDVPRDRAGPANPRTPYERSMHVNELSPLGLRRAFGSSFALRMWCAHRTRWDSHRGRFGKGRGVLDWFIQPEIWGIGTKRRRVDRVSQSPLP